MELFTRKANILLLAFVLVFNSVFEVQAAQIFSLQDVLNGARITIGLAAVGAGVSIATRITGELVARGGGEAGTGIVRAAQKAGQRSLQRAAMGGVMAALSFVPLTTRHAAKLGSVQGVLEGALEGVLMGLAVGPPIAAGLGLIVEPFMIMDERHERRMAGLEAFRREEERIARVVNWTAAQDGGPEVDFKGG